MKPSTDWNVPEKPWTVIFWMCVGWKDKKKMQSLDSDTSESSPQQPTKKAEKLLPKNALDDIWDRNPMMPSLSRMNSMECWDYTIELECLNGPQGYLGLLFFKCFLVSILKSSWTNHEKLKSRNSFRNKRWVESSKKMNGKKKLKWKLLILRLKTGFRKKVEIFKNVKFVKKLLENLIFFLEVLEVPSFTTLKWLWIEFTSLKLRLSILSWAKKNKNSQKISLRTISARYVSRLSFWSVWWLMRGRKRCKKEHEALLNCSCLKTSFSAIAFTDISLCSWNTRKKLPLDGK